jgi:hypothetical protein
VAYTNVISRTDAAATIPEEVAAEVTRGAIEQSAALRLFRHVTMSRGQQRIPVVSACRRLLRQRRHGPQADD